MPRKYLSLREINWRLVGSVYLLVFVCLFFYKYLDFVANNLHISFWVPLLEEFTGVFLAFCLFPISYTIAIRFPISRQTLSRNLPIHLFAVCVLSVVDTTAMALVRSALFPVVGLGRYHYGKMLARYPMEFAFYFLFYWVGVSLIYFFHEIRFARDGEIRQAKLEAKLAEAHVQTLRLQLEPHFLFNTLNSISAAIYEDARIADEMIGRLSELLRCLLKAERSQEVPLASELEMLRLYLRLMEARFESRLNAAIDVPTDVEQALVPQMILQPLVENAIRHGMDAVTFTANIRISARRNGSDLVLTVSDQGPGFQNPEAATGAGIGLRNTIDRLEALYGSRQSVKLVNAETGGAVVELRMPFLITPGLSIHPARDSVLSPR